MKYEATVAILTFNGETYIEDVLGALTRQKRVPPFEVLVIDSGSSDATLAVVERFVRAHHDVRLHQIPNAEFGHGRTRNLAARLAQGEFVAYLTHDAVPAHDEWLYELLKPFELSDRIVAVTGRQIPRAHCVPLLKYDIDAVFAHLGPVVGTTLFYADSFIRDQPTHDLVRFYSDVNSAARRSVLLDDVPYRDVSYAEDLQFGEDVVHRGYVKAYAPRGSVIHSNDLRLSEFRKRQFDEVFNVRANGTSISVPSRRRVARAILAGSVRDSSRILRDPEYSLAEKLRWLGVNPLFHVEKWRGIRSALTTAADDAASHARWSLDAMRRT